MLKFLFITCFVFVFVLSDCPDGTVDVSNESICLVPLQNMSYIFPQAEATCSQYNGNVVRIDSIYVNVLTQSLTELALHSNRTFVGVIRSPNNIWTLTDGSPLPYQNWASGEPSNTPGFDCVYLDVYSKYWYTIDCLSTKLPFICSAPKSFFSATTPTPRPVTTPNPSAPCSGCYPSSDNILLLVDVSPDNRHLDDVKGALLSTVKNWTHFERVALVAYAADFGILAFYNKIQNITDMNNLIKGMNQTGRGTANITKVLEDSVSYIALSKTYTGQQKTVLISARADNNDVTNALPFAQLLQSMGSVIVVALEFQVFNLARLASPSSAMDWDNTSDYLALHNFLDLALNQ